MTPAVPGGMGELLAPDHAEPRGSWTPSTPPAPYGGDASRCEVATISVFWGSGPSRHPHPQVGMAARSGSCR